MTKSILRDAFLNAECGIKDKNVQTEVCTFLHLIGGF